MATTTLKPHSCAARPPWAALPTSRSWKTPPVRRQERWATARDDDDLASSPVLVRRHPPSGGQPAAQNSQARADPWAKILHHRHGSSAEYVISSPATMRSTRASSYADRQDDLPVKRPEAARSEPKRMIFARMASTRVLISASGPYTYIAD